MNEITPIEQRVEKKQPNAPTFLFRKGNLNYYHDSSSVDYYNSIPYSTVWVQIEGQNEYNRIDSFYNNQTKKIITLTDLKNGKDDSANSISGNVSENENIFYWLYIILFLLFFIFVVIIIKKQNENV